MRNTLLAPETVDILEAPEEVLSTMTRDGKRRWLYPVLSRGAFNRQRLVVGWALIALFMALPIVRVNGRPAVLLDLMSREFALFGVVFYPTDTFYLLLMGIGGVLFIVLFTALLGRVWCGWACPQTVYMEFVFRPIERWFEGPEHVRKRRDEGPWTFDKTWRKTGKLSVYAVVALLLAHSFVAYFVGWDRLLTWMRGDPAEHWGYFVMMAFTAGLIVWDFGYFREQMCLITCPYARFQSVLLDPDSLIVSYDATRGEPRGKRGKKVLEAEAAGAPSEFGDCIACGACVRTCPTGIDIRDGLQMECIACTQCIDACDAIMDRIDKPRGLIRYTSENALAGRPTRSLRPRTVLYGALFVVVSVLFVGALAVRRPYDVNVGRIVGDPFMELPDGRIANRLRFRVRNQTAEAVTLSIRPLAPEGSEIRIVGTSPIDLAVREMKRIEVWVIAPADRFDHGTADGLFELQFSDGFVDERSFPLLGPS